MAKTSHVDSLFHHCGRICRHRLPDIFRMGPVRSPDGDLGTLLPGSFLCLHFASSSLWAQRNSGTCSAIWAADETGERESFAHRSILQKTNQQNKGRGLGNEITFASNRPSKTQEPAMSPPKK